MTLVSNKKYTHRSTPNPTNVYGHAFEDGQYIGVQSLVLHLSFAELVSKYLFIVLPINDISVIFKFSETSHTLTNNSFYFALKIMFQFFVINARFEN